MYIYILADALCIQFHWCIDRSKINSACDLAVLKSAISFPIKLRLKIYSLTSWCFHFVLICKFLLG